MGSREEILAIFQASTGLEDISTCIEILEQYEWSLELAVNSVLPQDFPAAASVSQPVEETGRGDDECVVDMGGRSMADHDHHYHHVDLTSTHQQKPLVDRTTVHSPDSAHFCHLTIYYNSSQHPVMLPDSNTVTQLKERLAYVIAIPAANQRLVGLPEGVSDNTQLREASLEQCGHCLRVEEVVDLVDQPHQEAREVVTLGSSDEEEYDDARETLSTGGEEEEEEKEEEEMDEDMFISDDTERSSCSMREPLIPSDCTEPVEALTYFSERFSQRYGDVHPLFFIGDLTDAVKEATGGSASKRKPMLIYLHHDKSILSNIFCSTLLCCESIVNYLTTNYLVWAWDLSMETLKRKLLDMVRECFGLAIARHVDDIKPDHLPVILIVYKAKGNVDVRNIIQGHIDPSTMMSHLIDATEQHQASAQFDLREELERKAREDMKLAQEEAFEQSLIADREKMRQKRAEEEERKQREADEQLALERKEEERRRMGDAVPPEPDLSCPDRVTTLRLRLPDSTTVQRRFLASLPLHTIVSYVGSLGYHPDEYKLLTSYPRRDISKLDGSLSLESVKLYPQETLFVEER